MSNIQPLDPKPVPAVAWTQEDARIHPLDLRHVLFQTAKMRYDADPESTAAGMYLLLAEALKEAQVFEFGRVPEKTFIEESKRGGELIAADLLDLPYRTCVLWTHYQQERDSDMPEMIRFCTVAHRLADLEDGQRRYLMLDAAAMPEPVATKMLMGKALPAGVSLFAVSAFGVITPMAAGKWTGVEIERASFTDAVDPLMSLASLADSVAGMSMILATRNIPMRTEVPSPKLQRKREKAGKRLLPTVTYVDTQRWLQAKANSAARGTHASPVPHLRRGHRRHYAAGTPRGGEHGKVVWIPDTLVNAKSYKEVAASRDHYEIDVPKEDTQCETTT